MTAIQWTQQTWNPIVGCSVVSPGCTNCYAMRMAWRLANNPATPHYHGTVKMMNGNPVWTGKVALAPGVTLCAPMHRRIPTTYFVNSMGDLFHEDVPDEWIDRVFAVMALCPQHRFQVLTKRAARMRAYLNDRSQARSDGRGEFVYELVRIHHPDPDAFCMESLQFPLPNVHLGVSAEDQRRADERIPDLVETPAAVRFVSYEPALGPVDFERWLAIDWQCSYCRDYFTGRHLPTCPNCGKEGGWCGSHAFNGRHYPDGPISPSQRGSGLDQIIVGGESGPGARPCNVGWLRSVVSQCQAAYVPVFVKQLGSKPTDELLRRMVLIDRKGGDMSEWPADLQIREMPR